MPNIKDLFPTYDDMLNDYNSVKNIFCMATTKDKIMHTIKYHNLLPTSVEINGVFASEYNDGDNNIQWVRCECWGCLDYIYFWIKDNKVNRIMFDVWCDSVGHSLMHDVTIDKINREYFEDTLNRQIKEDEKYIMFSKDCY